MPLLPILNLHPSELTITIHPVQKRSRPDNAQVEACWAELCATNPRLFNGPILAYTRFDASSNTIHAYVSDFKHLAVAAAFPNEDFAPTPPVTILSVTGVLTANTTDGTRCVCLGQRSHQTRVYGGLWELAPSGGIDVPQNLIGNGPWHHNGKLAVEALRHELAEELNHPSSSPANLESVRVIGLILDTPSGSMDVHIHAHLPSSVSPGPVSPRSPASGAGWEYDEAQWVALDSISEFVKTEPCIPPLHVFHKSGCFSLLFT